MTPRIEPLDGGVAIDVRVMPRSQPAGIAGERDGRLLVKVAAAPVDGAANAAVVASVAKWLGVAKSSVSIVTGERARNKRLKIAGLGQAEVQAAMERL